ncbi:His Kinase A (phospho-acceptor) domain-containing protein [Mucilaginibacter gossypiicola]|uniref:histidine kinase n=1 Tax=Mucilaginibacter gossypiicola TaxID=551995 RepID=A0A1H8P278_9SPHI|nr:HAMP domain-containing sensor histidine kinase [Mucilaginibacter gossypiicola]SEO36030.1 His Kinase A (phospho-acceptor) domain-containing protein [Mucilaginibacter gossypiicola]
MATLTATPQQSINANPHIAVFGSHDNFIEPVFPGQVLNPYAFLVDISERAHTREMAITNMLASAGIGMWSYGVYSKKFHLCPVASGFFGMKGSSTFGLGVLMQKLIQWNQKHVVDTARAACRTQQEFETELQINAADGCYGRWLKITGKLYCSDGLAMKMMGTLTDITAAKQEELRKNDLMAFLNHELRTPLSTIKLYIQNTVRVARLENNKPLEDKMLKADQQTVSMTQLINNFLTLSQVQDARLTLQKTSFNLAELVEEVTTDMMLLYPDRKFKLKAPKAVRVTADYDKLVQVLVNYVNNAVKFSHAKSVVTLTCSSINGEAVVTVEDKGRGIKLADQKLLFCRYSRIHHEKAAGTKGYGLGLYLSREIIESHCGEVGVNSEYGKGSSFYFSLPL